MHSIIFKMLSLFMSTLVFASYASDDKRLSFTQDEYYKMSVPELKQTRQHLRRSIAKNRKEATACVKSVTNCCTSEGVLVSLPIMAKIVSEQSHYCNAACLCGLAVLATVDSWYPWCVVRPQRAEFEKIRLALLKKQDDSEKQD